MKQVFLMIAALSLVGCGKKAPPPMPAAKKPELPKTEPKPEAKKPEPPKAEPKPLFNPNDKNHVTIEAAIRGAAKKLEGKLTKADLEKVTYLDLRYNELTDVSPLAGLKQLKELNLEETQLTDKQLKHLAGLTRLETLWLLNNNLTDLSVLVGLTQLTYLNVNDNELTDVSALAGLKQLKLLDLQGNPNLTKLEIDKLQKALPNCAIRHNAEK